MQTETIIYQLVASGYKDYVKIMLGDTEIVYIKTTKENFAFVEQELRHMVDSINIVPVLITSLKKLRGIEAWITPSERKLVKPIYDSIDEFEKTSFGKYLQSGLGKNKVLQENILRLTVIEASLQKRYIEALRQWRRTKSQRDRELYELIKDILVKEFDNDTNIIMNLNIRAV